MSAPLVEALREAGVPMDVAATVHVHRSTILPHLIKYASPSQRSALLRELLGERLAALAVEQRTGGKEVDLTQSGVGYDGDAPIQRVLDLLAPDEQTPIAELWPEENDGS